MGGKQGVSKDEKRRTIAKARNSKRARDGLRERKQYKEKQRHKRSSGYIIKKDNVAETETDRRN